MLRCVPKRTRVIARCEKIYEPYVERYFSSVCGNVPERIRENCVRAMQVPEFQKQQEIVADLDKLRAIMPLEDSAEGAMMLLMRDGQEVTLGMLLKSLGDYYDALGEVQGLVMETFNQIL